MRKSGSVPGASAAIRQILPFGSPPSLSSSAVAVCNLLFTLSRKYYELSDLPIGVQCQPCPRRVSQTRSCNCSGTMGNLPVLAFFGFSTHAQGSSDSAVSHLALAILREPSDVAFLVRTRSAHEKRISELNTVACASAGTDAQQTFCYRSRNLRRKRRSIATRSS